MADFGDYYLDELLALPLTSREWLVEGLMREKDSVILVGNEKSGKSLLIKQLIASLTTGHPFLDRYAVRKENKVVYIQLEGELADTQNRFQRLGKTLEYNHKNCLLMYRAPLEFHRKDFVVNFQRVIYEKLERTRPDVVIFDPVYFSFTGSLSDDEAVRTFIGNIRTFKEALACAVILVHHTHKKKWSVDGSTIDEGDEAMFGSKFFKAWADHILMFLYDSKKNTRTLLCNTQRSGDIIKECSLRLVEPDPLYFEVNMAGELNSVGTDLSIVNLLKECNAPDGMDADEISLALGISKSSFFKGIKKPIVENLIVKTMVQRPVKYMFNRIK